MRFLLTGTILRNFPAGMGGFFSPSTSFPFLSAREIDMVAQPEVVHFEIPSNERGYFRALAGVRCKSMNGEAQRRA